MSIAACKTYSNWSSRESQRRRHSQEKIANPAKAASEADIGRETAPLSTAEEEVLVEPEAVDEEEEPTVSLDSDPIVLALGCVAMVEVVELIAMVGAVGLAVAVARQDWYISALVNSYQ